MRPNIELDLTRFSPDLEERLAIITPVCMGHTVLSESEKADGLRLSWPTSGDRRRAVIGDSFLPTISRPPGNQIEMVHVSYEDFEMQYRFNKGGANAAVVHDSEAMVHRAEPVLHFPMLWDNVKMEAKEQELLQYCRSTINPLGSMYFCLQSQSNKLPSSPWPYTAMTRPIWPMCSSVWPLQTIRCLLEPS
jgi:hypothetical protein